MAKKATLPAAKPRFVSLRDAGLGALLLVSALVAYSPALNGGLLWDDDGHVVKQELQSLHGLWRIWFDLGATQQYYPLLHSAFWLEHLLWGDSVLGYHLINVFLHVLAACLVVAIVRRLALPGAWLAGFLFALHPVCVEAVAWISEQKSTLSTVFYLAAALTYLKFDSSRRRPLYALASVFFVAALLSKTVTATLPAALLVVFWWKRKRLSLQSDVLPLLPWFVTGAAAGLFTAWVERTYIGAEGSDFALTGLQRLLLAGRVLWFYLAKLLWPSNLTFIYPRWTVDPAQWWQFLFPLGILILVGGLCWLARRHRGPLAGFLFFAGTLFPVLGFFNVYPFLYSYVADHFQYVASLGILVPLACGITLASSRLPLSGKALTPALPLLIVALLGALTWQQSGMYRDAETLYRATLQRNPSCWMAHNNLGSILSKTPGRMPEAISEYQTALQLRPNYPEAHNNLGNALLDLPGRAPEAVLHLQAALSIKGIRDAVHNNLGLAYSKIPGRMPDALAQYNAALQLNPNLPAAHYNLANALAATPGHEAESIAHFEAALRGDRDLAAIHNNLGMTLSRIPGRASEALAHYQAAARIDPYLAEAQLNLGLAYMKNPQTQADAIPHFEAALRVRPNYLEAHYNLALVLLQMGRNADALPHLKEVLRLRPDLAQVRELIGRLQANP